MNFQLAGKPGGDEANAMDVNPVSFTQRSHVCFMARRQAWALPLGCPPLPLGYLSSECKVIDLRLYIVAYLKYLTWADNFLILTALSNTIILIITKQSSITIIFL